MERWKPNREPTKQEQFILKRLETKRKLFGFLRRHRHELFDDQFQGERETMYRDTGAGSDPRPPAQLAMALLLQGYLGLSDADAVEAAVMALRWQMVLGCLGATEPPFSQGALQAFRERLIAHDMDRRLLDRTVELARATKEFDWKKLPKTLRVAIDSAPLEGAGRVEDTLNLLAHAARRVVDCAADLLRWTPEQVCREARAPLLLAPSLKAGGSRHSTLRFRMCRPRAGPAGLLCRHRSRVSPLPSASPRPGHRRCVGAAGRKLVSPRRAP
ncbi:MAG: transposase [Anaeromyxobacter sp.]